MEMSINVPPIMQWSWIPWFNMCKNFDVLDTKCSILRNMVNNLNKRIPPYYLQPHDVNDFSLRMSQRGRYCLSNDGRYGPRKPRLPSLQHWIRWSQQPPPLSLVFVYCKSIRITGFFLRLYTYKKFRNAIVIDVSNFLFLAFFDLSYWRNYGNWLYVLLVVYLCYNLLKYKSPSVGFFLKCCKCYWKNGFLIFLGLGT